MNAGQGASSSSSSSAHLHLGSHDFDEHDERVALMVDSNHSEICGDDHRQTVYNLKSQSLPEIRVLSSIDNSGLQVYKSAKRSRRVVRSLLIFGLRGFENFLVYLWIIKDLAWTQTWYQTSIAFGFLSVFVQSILLLQSIYDRNFSEAWHNTATTMWLFSNFWAMTGEEYDEKFSLNRLGDARDLQSGYLMGATLCWLGLYHILLYPFGFIPVAAKSVIPTRYEEAGLKSRFFFFQNWRQYEYMHIVCWLAKDWSWTMGFKWLWIFWSVPTLFVAVDFVYVTGKFKLLVIDYAHYWAQLMWVIGNIIWASGDFFYDPDAGPVPLYEWRPLSLRWWASWTIATALLPIMWLYAYYFPKNYCSRNKASSKLMHYYNSATSLSKIDESNFERFHDLDHEQQSTDVTCFER
jgi:hypothetical protein